MLTRKFKLFPLKDIVVPAERQRSGKSDLTSLKHSIANLGLINPLTVTKDGELVAGFRRLSAMLELAKDNPKKWETVPVHFYDELTSAEKYLVELDENIRREQLSWQDQALAFEKYHTVLSGLQGEDWNADRTADYAGIARTTLYKALNVAPELRAENPRVHAFESLGAADNFLSRLNARAAEAELEKVSLDDIFNDQADEQPVRDQHPAEKASAPQELVRAAAHDILMLDALGWMPAYAGPRFNLIHCDFPYGIGMHKSAQTNAESWETYEDTPEIFFGLLECMLYNRNRLMAQSAHMVFWFSMGFYGPTIELFSRLAPELVVNPFPLVWHKSDLRGILPDPERGPRRTYETALLISRGDRKVVKAVANSYPAPTMKSESDHVSQKPEPVLNHFFRMLVDESTTLLDMTCGSGTALCSAERLGAERVLGLDMDAEHVKLAQDNLNRSRRLRFLEKTVERENLEES